MVMPGKAVGTLSGGVIATARTPNQGVPVLARSGMGMHALCGKERCRTYASVSSPEYEFWVTDEYVVTSGWDRRTAVWAEGMCTHSLPLARQNSFTRLD